MDLLLNSFTITFLFIILSTLVAAFFRKRGRDKCLIHFEDDPIVLEKTNGDLIPCGNLHVENTGLEFVFKEKIRGDFGLLKTTYLLYKYEFPQIQALIRYHDELSKEEQEKRLNEIKKVYHPRFRRRTWRKIQNIFKTIKDSFAEILTLFITHIQKVGTTGKIIKDQNKYVNQMKSNLIESVGTAYEPLLEQYIGKLVVFELIRNESVVKFKGILKDYTVTFIEILDVDYALSDEENTRRADLILPQKLCIIRHLGEVDKDFSILKKIKDFVPLKIGKITS